MVRVRLVLRDPAYLELSSLRYRSADRDPLGELRYPDFAWWDMADRWGVGVIDVGSVVGNGGQDVIFLVAFRVFVVREVTLQPPAGEVLALRGGVGAPFCQVFVLQVRDRWVRARGRRSAVMNDHVVVDAVSVVVDVFLDAVGVSFLCFKVPLLGQDFSKGIRRVEPSPA